MSQRTCILLMLSTFGLNGGCQSTLAVEPPPDRVVHPAEAVRPDVSRLKPTQVLILASPHLGVLKDRFRPNLLAPVLARLAKFTPDAVAVERIPPRILEAMAQGPYNDVIEYWTPALVKQMPTLQKKLELSRHQAERKSAALLAKGPPSDDALIPTLLAAGDHLSAVLHWSYLSPEARQPRGALSAELVRLLNETLAKPHEDIALGLQLARQLSHRRMHYIDDHQDKDDLYGRTMDALEPHFAKDGIYGKTDSPTIVSALRLLQQAPTNGSLLTVYEQFNTPKYQRGDVSEQWAIFFRSRLPSGADRARMALWEVRNLNMVAHIMRVVAEHPGGRILVVVGASHKPFLDTYLSRAMDVQLVQFQDLVYPEAIARASP